MANWFQRTADAIQREYERRIRRASQITEYGQPHHEHAEPAQDDEEGAAEIVNVPRGTTVAPASRSSQNGASDS